MDDCLFCKIIKGEIPSTKVFENDKVYAFMDIAPQAPTHAVVVPKEHIACANELNSDNIAAVADVFEAIPEIAKALGLDKTGYRVVNNCGADAGQTVHHIHFHILGGKELGAMA